MNIRTDKRLNYYCVLEIATPLRPHFCLQFCHMSSYHGSAYAFVCRFSALSLCFCLSL